ncbi:helix-turn-helix domain-containing protein [Methylosinus sp. H3A]|uniref:helix-turn-helix domain-containing protein n=1 Tax=Methylosinus sp. H3A TaxID=2785786 RepID=UPI0018C2343C|nr:helix-turn-helix domain-containing protein [Methylosinus sp. H3A]MBG0809731.1 helix-turn-helix domain-containing protein [Methylosinus sp. H3A]
MADPIVAVVAYDGISLFHLSAPCLIFGEDQTQLGLPRFDFRVCALEDGAMRTDAGLTLTTPHRLSGLDDADIVVVPSWKELDKPPPAALVEALRLSHARGALLVGLCLGAFALAATGVLAGRRATTHWAYADKLRALYPDIAVEPEVLYIDNGDVVTSAGVAAGLDCCLHIVRARYGADAALRLARRIVLSPHRQGGQAQFIERPVAKTPKADRFARALDRVRATLDEPHSLDRVAEAAGLTRRTFTRRFQKTIGASFGEWLVDRRLEEAQRLLESTDDSIDSIAFRTGFGTAASLRRRFAERLEIAPTQYRRAFSKRAEPVRTAGTPGSRNRTSG